MSNPSDNISHTINGNLIKHYGFYYPPVGIISVLNLIFTPFDASFYIIDPILAKDHELPYNELSQQSNPYVIISTQEGSSHRWFDRLIPKLTDHGIAMNHIIIRSACLWDPDSPVKHIHTIVDECSDFVSALETNQPVIQDPTHHFVCLNRLHRWQRYELVKQILDRNLDQFGKLSYIQLKPDSDPRFLNLTKPDVDWNEQRNMSDSDTTGALFNIICEAAYEPEPGTAQLIHHHRPGMTEKSYKCFALHQIPIWLAPYRAVECYRQLGFDVFDDLVDHSYDQEPDPEKRIELVANQIEKNCRLTPEQLVKFKKDLKARFDKNLAVLESYAHNFNTELPQWQALF